MLEAGGSDAAGGVDDEAAESEDAGGSEGAAGGSEEVGGTAGVDEGASDDAVELEPGQSAAQTPPHTALGVGHEQSPEMSENPLVQEKLQGFLSHDCY